MQTLANRFGIGVGAIIVIFALGIPSIGVADTEFLKMVVTASIAISAVIIGITAGVVAAHLGAIHVPQLVVSRVGTLLIGVIMAGSTFWATDCVLTNSAIDPNVLCAPRGHFIQNSPEIQSVNALEQSK